MDDLALMLRPAGGGQFTVSTGRAEQLALQKQIYGAADEAHVAALWRGNLQALDGAEMAVLGIPSDTGAGLVRGAAYGPRALRTAWLARDEGFGRGLRTGQIVDVGDVPSIPQILHDEMLSEGQKAACRRALYPDVPAGHAASLPVSPLSIAERVVQLLLARHPRLRLLSLGGDHSVTWPIVSALADHMDRERRPWGIVHFDAHTDLLAERFGIKHCFATWAYHANERLGRGGRMVQMGLRASARERGHWESTLGVRQFWIDDLQMMSVDRVVETVVAHFAALGIAALYISNDIDGTDGLAAPATGTPEPRGLAPDMVTGIIRGLGQAFDVVGADLVEVAPTVGAEDGIARTLSVAASYLETTRLALTRGGSS
jgi:agmatinase